MGEDHHGSAPFYVFFSHEYAKYAKGLRSCKYKHDGQASEFDLRFFMIVY